MGSTSSKFLIQPKLPSDIDRQISGESGKDDFVLIDGNEVKYNKGDVIERELTPLDIGRLAFAQKSVRHRRDSEFRYSIHMRATEETHSDIKIPLGKPLRYACMLK